MRIRAIFAPMNQNELISIFPQQYSIPDRVLLVNPQSIGMLEGKSIQGCRVFMLVVSGSLTLQTGVNRTVVDAGTYVDMLVWDAVTFTGFSSNLNAWCLFPNYVFTNESLNGLKPAETESFKERRTVPVVSLAENESQVLNRQLTELARALSDLDNHYRTELCQCAFRSFMLHTGNIMLRHDVTAEEMDNIESRQDVIMRGFLKLVWKYYKSEHNIDFYAGRLCISSKHLSRVVRSKLGKTPYAVIRDEILQRACYLLQHTKIQVQDIASELHFSEMAAFCKFFRKHSGMTPTAYRGIKQF